jgi:hypothetical protein
MLLEMASSLTPIHHDSLFSKASAENQVTFIRQISKDLRVDFISMFFRANSNLPSIEVAARQRQLCSSAHTAPGEQGDYNPKNPKQSANRNPDRLPRDRALVGLFAAASIGSAAIGWNNGSGLQLHHGVSFHREER